jgi:nucleoside-diphosphate-sugar epimerase
VHFSSTDVYGHPGHARVDETLPRAGFANWYAQTKLEGEGEVRRAAESGPLETVVLRPATVYGPGSRELVGEIAAAIRGRHMLLVGRGRSNAGLLYVENLLDAVQLALDHPRARGETFNISDELDVSWARFTSDLAAGLGAPPVRLSLSYPVAFALGLSLESAYRLARTLTGLRLAPLLSRQAVQVLGRDQRFSAGRARERLGWEPRVGYRDGMRATLDWLQAQRPPKRARQVGKDARRAGV